MKVRDMKAKADLLRELHGRGMLLVLPNAWDCMSAKIFEDCGFPAIATTSAGIAWARGYPDGERLYWDEMAEAIGLIADTVSVPVTADVEAGYGDSPQSVARMARAVIVAGAIGLNLEDSADPEPPGRAASSRRGDTSLLLEADEQSERVWAVVEVGRATGVPLVVNARTDVYWREVGDPERRFGETVRRANAFLEAGADCVFVPGVKNPETIAGLVQEIPGPLNVLAGPGSLSISELAELGVRRVSVGSGPARAIMGLTRSMGRELLGSGSYQAMGHGALPYPEANALFESHTRPEL